MILLSFTWIFGHIIISYPSCCKETFILPATPYSEQHYILYYGKVCRRLNLNLLLPAEYPQLQIQNYNMFY
jgi:hypothetical protein